MRRGRRDQRHAVATLHQDAARCSSCNGSARSVPASDRWVGCAQKAIVACPCVRRADAVSVGRCRLSQQSQQDPAPRPPRRLRGLWPTKASRHGALRRIECLDRPFCFGTGSLADRVRRAARGLRLSAKCRPDRLFAPQKIAFATSLRIDGDDEVIGFTEPRRHRGSESRLHLDMDFLAGYPKIHVEMETGTHFLDAGAAR